MRALLLTTAILEVATGVVLLALPAMFVSALLGGTLDTPTSFALARLAGIALLSLGIVCWVGSRETRSRAMTGIVAAMLFYNTAVPILLLSLRYGVGLTGIGLLPVSVLHLALAAWCITRLRAVRDAPNPT